MYSSSVVTERDLSKKRRDEESKISYDTVKVTV